MSVAPLEVAIVNESSVLTSSQVDAIVASLQLQVTYHFKPHWGRGCKLVHTASLPAARWALVFLDDSDQAGALGYHDWTPTGEPLGKVFAKTDLDNGYLPSVTASHELLEMLADPWVDHAVQVGASTFYALEVADACEADGYGYQINGVTVSDFVYPAWFSQGAPGPYDHAARISAPLRLLPGGYIGEYVCGQGWTQRTAATGVAPPSRRLRLRRERRSG